MNLFVVLAAALALASSSVPPNFKKCLRKDPNFKKCYHEAAQHGMTLLTRPYKQLDLQSVDPLEITSLTLHGGGGPVSLDHKYSNCNIYGLATTKYDTFELDLNKRTLTIDGVVDEMLLKCHYQLKGKVLLLAIQGEGDSAITFKKYRIKYDAGFEEYMKGDETYYKMVSSELATDAEGVHFHYDNLFNGDKTLGDNINLVLNDNWKEVFEDIRPQFDDIVRQIADNFMKRIWKSTSLEEFFD